MTSQEARVLGQECWGKSAATANGPRDVRRSEAATSILRAPGTARAGVSWRRVVRGPEASTSSWVRAEVRAPHQMEERRPFSCSSTLQRSRCIAGAG